MQEKRKFQRFEVDLTARCFGVGRRENQECRVVEISRQGIMLTLQLNEKIKAGRSCLFEIQLPESSETISMLVKIQWVRGAAPPAGSGYTVGGKLVMINARDKQLLMDHAYQELISREKGG